MLRYYSSWGQAFKIMENHILLGVYMFERAKNISKVTLKNKLYAIYLTL